MGIRWLVGVGIALAVLVVPSAGQTPPPPCTAGQQFVPDRFELEDTGVGDPLTSLTVGHPGQVAIYLPNDGRSVEPSNLKLTSPDVALKAQFPGESLSQVGEFTPKTAGMLTFAATWTQLTAFGGSPCAGAVSLSAAATAPTPVRAHKGIYFSVDHRSGQRGATNEFVIQTYALSSATHGDRSPFRMVVRAVASGHRPSPSARAATLIFDPLTAPPKGARLLTPLVKLGAREKVDLSQSNNAEYDFSVGVAALPGRGKSHAHRGVDVKISQGSKTLFAYHLVTSCDTLHGGLFCFPVPKGAITGR